MSFAVAAVGALMFHTLAVGFVVPNLRSRALGAAKPAALQLPEQVVPGRFFRDSNLAEFHSILREIGSFNFSSAFELFPACGSSA